MLTLAMTEATSYRDFLQIFLKSKQVDGKKINFSALSRSAGFSSRSFIKEVLEGKKHLTQASLARFIKAFKLTGLAARYFECLVALEEERIEVGFKDIAQVQNELARIRARVLRNQKIVTKSEKNHARSNWAFKLQNMAEVYAALGSQENGASLDQIHTRTGLSRSKCEKILRHMLDNEAILTSADRFFVIHPNFDILGLGDSDGFAAYFRDAVDQLEKKCRHSIQSNEELYFHSALSLDRSQLPSLKKKLQELLIEFLDEIQNDDGDRVAKITVGFYL